MKTSTLLKLALNLFKKKKLCKGEYCIVSNKFSNWNSEREVKTTPLKEICGFCALGPVLRLAENNQKFEEAAKYLRQAIPFKSNYEYVDSYNDAKSRKKADIVKLYCKAIALAKKEEKQS